MRLIDADAFTKWWRETYCDKCKRKKTIDCVGCVDDHFLKCLEKYAPTIDAEPVVRCKDCIHRVKGAKMCMHPKVIGWDAIEPEDDDFCSYGERSKTND